MEAGNGLMAGRGQLAQANRQVAGRVELCDLATFIPTLDERDLFPGDLITPAVIRLVRHAIGKGRDVLLLARRNGLPWYFSGRKPKDAASRVLEDVFLVNVQAHLPEADRDKVRIVTAHKSKGLEHHTVIVLDAEVRSYPLLHPNWVFFQLFGDSLSSIVDAERRLLYVALTRAANELLVITEGSVLSPFLEEIERTSRFPRLDWRDYPGVVKEDPATFTVLITTEPSGQAGGTYSIRHLLKSDQFRWDPAKRAWQRRVDALTFTLELLQAAPWSSRADGILVTICDDRLDLVARYAVRAGTWHREFAHPSFE